MAAGPQARLVNVQIFPAAVREVLNQPAAHQAMLTVGNAVAAEVRRIVPRSKRTRQNASGEPHKHLVDNLFVTTGTHDGVASATITAAVEHALAFHQGAGPHPIDARDSAKAMLKFGPMPGYSTPFVGPHVDHPGSGPRPFFRQACSQLGLVFHPATGAG